jgi:hypothetical protein
LVFFFFSSPSVFFFLSTIFSSLCFLFPVVRDLFFSPSRSSFSLASSVSLRRNRETKVCSWLSSHLCIMSVWRGKGVAQPETRLALLYWLANAPHCFCLSSLLSLGSPGSIFAFPPFSVHLLCSIFIGKRTPLQLLE